MQVDKIDIDLEIFLQLHPIFDLPKLKQRQVPFLRSTTPVLTSVYLAPRLWLEIRGQCRLGGTDRLLQRRV
jgi:hypothetical protein